MRCCPPLTPTLSPPAGRGRDPREAWEGEGRAPREPHERIFRPAIPRSKPQSSPELERLFRLVVSRTSCGVRRRLIGSCPKEKSMPSRFKIFAIAAVLAAGTSSVAMAQYACPAGYALYNGVCQSAAGYAPSNPVSGAAAGAAQGAAVGGATGGPVGAVV